MQGKKAEFVGKDYRPLRYEPPAIREHGTLAQITADTGMLLDATRTGLRLAVALASSPIVPGGGGSGNPSEIAASSVPDAGGVLGATQPGGAGTVDPSSFTPSPGGTLGESVGGGVDPGSTAGGAGTGGGTSGSGGGGGGGRLPFTGLAVIGIAAVGAAAAGAGSTLRRLTRRDRSSGTGLS